MRREVFERLDVPAAWRTSCSDDLMLRRVLVSHGLRVVSVADALAVSHQSYTWRTYWDFLVRQLILARVYTPALWWQVLVLYTVVTVAMLYGVVGSVAWLLGFSVNGQALAALPLIPLFMVQGWVVVDGAQRALARRDEQVPQIAGWMMPAYVLGGLVGYLQVLASARRRWILWRGVVYHLYAADQTGVFRPSRPPGDTGGTRVVVSPAFKAMLAGWLDGVEPADATQASAEVGALQRTEGVSASQRAEG
jgi:hypothetical protein